MTKKRTRDTREAQKDWSQKAAKPQGRKAAKSQGQKASKARIRDDQDIGNAPKAQTRDARYSYVDCLCDEVPAPAGTNGSTIYQLLMVGCMVLFVFTANGVGESGASFLTRSHWMYPLMFCIALLVQTYIGAPAVRFLAPRLIENRLTGPARGVARTVLSTCITSPITSAIMSALFSDPDDFASVYVASLSITMPMAMFTSLFIVGPLVKLLFHNRISPAGGLRALQVMEQCAPSIYRLLGM